MRGAALESRRCWCSRAVCFAEVNPQRQDMHVAVVESGRDGTAVYGDALRVGVARGEVVFRARRHDAPLAHNHRFRQRQFVPKSVYRRAIDEVHSQEIRRNHRFPAHGAHFFALTPSPSPTSWERGEPCADLFGVLKR